MKKSIGISVLMPLFMISSHSIADTTHGKITFIGTTGKLVTAVLILLQSSIVFWGSWNLHILTILPIFATCTAHFYPHISLEKWCELTAFPAMRVQRRLRLLLGHISRWHNRMKLKVKKFLVGLLCIAGGLGAVLPVQADDFGKQIPYAAIEGVLRDLIASQVNGRFTGYEKCRTILCPDADWRADVSSNIRFTKNPQLAFIPLGPSPWIDGFQVKLDTQFEVNLYAAVYIKINGPAKDISFNVPINKIIGVHFSAIVYTEPAPELKSDSIAFSLSDDGGNVQINGLNRDMTILGIEAGAIVGLVLVGDPITGGILGAVVGNTAANKAKDKIRAEVSRRAAVAISQASLEGNNQLRKYVIPNIQRVNSVIGFFPSFL